MLRARFYKFKFSLLAAAIFSFSSHPLFADSATNNAGFLVATQSTVANQPFLLDSGVFNYFFGAQQNITTNTARGRCPTGWQVFARLYPYKSQSSGGSLANGSVANDVKGFSGTCVRSVTANVPTNNYTIAYQSSQLSSGWTNVGIGWDILCYPAGVTLPQTTDSACSVPAGSFDQPFFLWDTGSILGGQGNTWYNTNRKCPPNYNPYVVFTLYETLADTMQYSSSSSNSPGKSYMCMDTGNQPSDQGTYYRFNTWFAEVSGWRGNQAATWALYCYPTNGNVPAPSYPACGTTGAANYQAIYNFQPQGTLGITGNQSYIYAQYFNASNNGWAIPFAGTQYSTTPAWNTAVLVPSSGTYLLTLTVTLLNTAGNAGVIAFYLNDTTSGASLGSFMVPNAGYGNLPRIYVPQASNGQPGMISTSAVFNLNGSSGGNVYLTGGHYLSVTGIVWSGTTNTIYVLSDGSLTLTRIGN